MRHLFFMAAVAMLFAPASRAQTIIWSDSFENGLSNWTTGTGISGCGSACENGCSCAGAWQVLDPTIPCWNGAQPIPDGTHVAWFGIQSSCTYDGGEGFASNHWLRSSTPVQLPTGAGNLTLRLWTKSECELPVGFDRRTLGVSGSSGPGLFGSFANSGWIEKQYDLTHLAGQSVTITFNFDSVDDIDNAHAGWFLDAIRIESAPDPGTRFCSGDGTAAACPCGLPGAPGRGCPTGFSSQGAGLSSSGTPQVSADSITLRASGVLSSSVLFFQGTTQVAAGQGAPFGDGLRCAGGSIVRLGTAAGNGESALYPKAGDPPVSTRGSVPAGGGTRTYQAWYRDVLAYCTPSNFNLTNGLSLPWTP